MGKIALLVSREEMLYQAHNILQEKKYQIDEMRVIRSESAVMEAIEHLQGMKTMLIIAHRLTTIRNVDVIYEVGGGKVTQKRKDEVFTDL